jgi:hypothetical protein
MGFITGKSTQKSESKNLAYPYLKDAYSGAVSTGTNAMQLMQQLLGGGPGGDAAYKAYQDSTGYQNVIDSGSKAITGNAASRGLLRSGATGKALVNFGQEAAKSNFNNYLQHLLGLSGQDLQAGGLIAGAGQTNTQTSKSKPGLGSTIGAGLSMIPSDPRLKTDITRVGTAKNGLGLYRYRYLWDNEDTIRTGYMADEVAEIAPDALGPELPGGYMTVDYSKLPKIGDH